MKPRVGIIVTLDTKNKECEFIKASIRANDAEPVVIDIGVRSTQEGNSPDQISRPEIYAMAGMPDTGHGERAEAINAVKTALSKAINRIIDDYSLQSLIGIGGVQGSVIVSEAYDTLPFGFPCVLVSTVASGERKFNLIVKNKDIVVLNTIVDLMGLNEITKKVLENGAIIACTLALHQDLHRAGRKKIAISVMGITNKSSEYLYGKLTDMGFEVLTFHATGAGGDAMERFIEKDYFDGVIDLSTHELSAELLGGFSRGQSKRLTAISDSDAPVVIVPGAVEIFDFLLKGNEHELDGRQYTYHNEDIIHARCREDELTEIAGTMAARFNNIEQDCMMMIPERGFSANTNVGCTLENHELDRFLISQLVRRIDKKERIETYDLHIEDEAFCDYIITMFMGLMEAKDRG
ncbi:Tm-1-like ATP-binding domain-containing protein [Thermodesulfobacteriota bacterium]